MKGEMRLVAGARQANSSIDSRGRSTSSSSLSSQSFECEKHERGRATQSGRSALNMPAKQGSLSPALGPLSGSLVDSGSKTSVLSLASGGPSSSAASRLLFLGLPRTATHNYLELHSLAQVERAREDNQTSWRESRLRFDCSCPEFARVASLART